MSILVVGSVAYDDVETPFGKVDNALGGAATFFSAAASYFSPIRLVAVVGDDFQKECLGFLERRDVDLEGLEFKSGKTFRWGGKYSMDLNDRDTLYTHLNVFQDFQPKIPDAYRHSDYVFLANIAPELQMDVLRQIDSPRLVALDTMNFWIEGSLPALKETLAKVDVLLINDSEAKLLAEENNLVKASRRIFEMGPKIIIIKKGEHGALLITPEMFFLAPAYPLETILDPTGAGDTFAGGFMGYLAHSGDVGGESLKHAVIFGSTLASFCCEKFSMDRLKELTADEIRSRFTEFWKMTHFDHTKITW